MNDATPSPATLAPLTDDLVRQALATVYDPEIGHSITALGLVDQIDITPGRVQITLVPTSATCPMADLIIEHAESAVRQLCPPSTVVEVDMDWEQTWTPDRMSEDLRRSFGW